MQMISKIKFIPRFLSQKEIKLMRLLIFITVLSAAFLATQIYLRKSVLNPAKGGQYIEGISGYPHFINPLYARNNDVDTDITSLVFSSLIKQYDQSFYNDLAAKYEISEDKTTYTFYIKRDVYWHDQEPLTAYDVEFTAKAIQDKRLNSPLSASLQGVQINTIDENTIQFILPKPFAPFLSSLAFYILPEHIWSTIDYSSYPLSDFNIKPIGSGPFKFESLKKETSTGKIKSIKLSAYENYHGKRPYLENITFKFYDSYEEIVSALNNKSIDGANFLPRNYIDQIVNNEVSVKSLSLPQYTALFINQNNNPILQDKKIRQALAHSINKAELVNNVLNGQGSVIQGPILPGFIGYHNEIKKYEYDAEKANTLLDDLGWKRVPREDYIKELIEEEKQRAEEELKQAKESNESIIRIAAEILKDKTSFSGQDGSAKPSNIEEDKESEPTFEEKLNQELTQAFFRKKDGQTLEFTITTVNQPETSASAAIVKKLFENAGIKTNINLVEPENIISKTIEPRNYEILLYGIIVLDDPDPYAVWHSSQTEPPGVNLSMYKNTAMDVLLEKARQTDEQEERNKIYIEFQNILKEEMPAIFLYNPTYSFVLNNKIKGFTIKKVTTPTDRFLEITDWYTKTKRAFKL